MATFGYTVAGGTQQTVGSAEMNITEYTMNANGGTMTSMSAYLGDGGLPGNAAGAALYSDSADTPNLQLAVDSGNVSVSGNAATLYTWTMPSTALAASTKYWLAHFLSTSQGYFYDAGATLHIFLANTFENWPSPWSGGSSAFPRTLSIYITYTPALQFTQNIRSQMIPNIRPRPFAPGLAR